jgi:hypothetical protein
MLQDLLALALPLLCGGLVAAGVVLDRRLARGAGRDDASADERFALAMLADSLIRGLDLRPDCAEALRAELHRERALVFAWLASRPPHRAAPLEMPRRTGTPDAPPRDLR